MTIEVDSRDTTIVKPQPTAAFETVAAMLDIETLGKKPTAVITQIGFIAWDTVSQNHIEELHHHLPIHPQLAAGRTVDADTLVWWLQQSDEARNSFRYPQVMDDEGALIAQLKHFRRIYQQLLFSFPNMTLWARGPQFDVVLLENLLNQYDLEVPWKYSAVRDLRTLMEISFTTLPRNASETAHNAISDAEYQIRCYHEALRQLRR